MIISDHDPAISGRRQGALAGKGEVEAVTLDVTDAGGGRRGGARRPTPRIGAIDILIANAGIAWPDTPRRGDARRGLAQSHRRRSQRRVLVLPRIRPRNAGARARARSSRSARCRA